MCRNCIFLLVIAAVGQIKIVFFSAMISPGMHYDAGLCRPAGGGSCSPAFRAAGSTTIVFYRQHVLKSMLKWSHPRMYGRSFDACCALLAEVPMCLHHAHMSPGPRTRRVPRLGIEQKRGTAKGIRRDYLRVFLRPRKSVLDWFSLHAA